MAHVYPVYFVAGQANSLRSTGLWGKGGPELYRRARVVPLAIASLALRSAHAARWYKLSARPEVLKAQNFKAPAAARKPRAKGLTALT
jgi:hypothetical protein